MITIGLDFETYWDTKYNLKKLHTLEYVRHEKFKAHGAAVHMGGKTQWIHGADLKSFFSGLDWSNTIVVCHHVYFDGLILFEQFKCIPAKYHCTLSMGRALFPFTGHGLDSLGENLGVGGKISGVLDKTIGVVDLPPELEKELATYSEQDVDIMMAIYSHMLPAFPQDELDLMDLTLRWGCIPTLWVDIPRAKVALEKTILEQSTTIEASGVDKKVLSSNPQFANHLRSIGITPPTKLSPTTHKETYALAKNDLAFVELMADHSDQQTLWDARLAAKSNLLRTRTQRIINIGAGGACLPMPLKYCGAHTLRWSGQDGLNPQNFPRGSELRKSIIAPPGYEIVVADLAQIELRLNFWFCGQDNLLDVFRGGRDIYKDTAAKHYNINYEEVDKHQRFFAKQLDLGLGYGMGPARFRRECALKKIYMSPREATAVVWEYRYGHLFVKNMWDTMNHMIYHMFNDTEQTIKCVGFREEAVLLPNGMSLSYSGLTPHENNQWTYGGGRKLYGALLLENIIQALARVVLGEMMLEISRNYAWIKIVSSTHDEIIALVREEVAAEALSIILYIMGVSPTWAPDLPLSGDGAHERYYCK